MSLSNIDIESAMRRLADKRIEEAISEGKFDNLQGAGQPLDLEPLPADENARMAWWMLRIMRNNDYLPDEIRLRKSIDAFKLELAALRDESKLAALCGKINGLVQKLNTLGTNAISLGVTGVELETERLRLRDRAGSSS
jgi:hypothetical protein